MEFKKSAEFFNGAIKVISTKSFPDARGYFNLSYLEDQLKTIGIPNRFIREMHTRSKEGVLRGLHFQHIPPMGKLVQLIRGSIFMAVVDIRSESPTFLEPVTFDLRDGCTDLFWIPSGFALGYLTLEPDTIVHYKCDNYAGQEHTIAWDDPDIAIPWPRTNPILSEQDEKAPLAYGHFWYRR